MIFRNRRDRPQCAHRSPGTRASSRRSWTICPGRRRISTRTAWRCSTCRAMSRRGRAAPPRPTGSRPTRPIRAQACFHAAGRDASRAAVHGRQPARQDAGRRDRGGDAPDRALSDGLAGPPLRPRPITAWAAGATAETTRDNVQRLLLGRPARQRAPAILPAAPSPAPTARAASPTELVDYGRACATPRGGVVAPRAQDPTTRAARSGRARRSTWSGSTRSRRSRSTARA